MHSAAPQPHLPGTDPSQPHTTPPHLLLPTDMAHSRGRCWAGGGPQDRHDPLGEDLTHCKGQRRDHRIRDPLFPLCPTHLRATLVQERIGHSGLPDPSPPSQIQRPNSDPAQCSVQQKEKEERETEGQSHRGTGHAKGNKGKQRESNTRDLLLTCGPSASCSASCFSVFPAMSPPTSHPALLYPEVPAKRPWFSGLQT